MDAGDQAIVVFVTAASEPEATRLAEALVAEQLAACVNIVANIHSIYRWQGKVQQDREHLLIIKTRRAKFAALELRVRALHSYDVPEVIAVEVVDGSERYLAWIRDNTPTATQQQEGIRNE